MRTFCASSIVAMVTCALSAAGQVIKEPVLSPHPVDKLRMVGNVGGSTGPRDPRSSTLVDLYSNVDLGANSYVFYHPPAHLAGDPIVTEKGGVNLSGNTVGPVASPGTVFGMELWIIADDGTSSEVQYDCTVTIELFDTFLDWIPAGTSCTSDGDSVAQASLGRIQIDLTGDFAPYNGYANGYIINNIPAVGVLWKLTDGNGFVDERCWVYNNGSPPTTLHSSVYPAFDGVVAACGYPPGAYPALGVSDDNCYLDLNHDGRYTANERVRFGGTPFIANLMIRLFGDDGCTLDFNGDGFVNGDDIGYAGFLFDSGCE